MGDTAVLVVDVMNAYRHPDAVALLDAGLGAAALTVAYRGVRVRM
ncbi:hypothetical protein [Mycobacterium sp.]